MSQFRLWRDVRSRLLTIVLAALAIALGATTYGFNLLFAQTTSRDASSLLHARAESELGLLQLRQGRLHVAETSDDATADSLVWIFDRTGIVERPRAQAASDAVAASFAGAPGGFRDVSADDVRLYAVPIVLDGTRRGTLVTGISLAPYEQTERTALIGSLALAAVLLALVAVAVFFLLRGALRPVARMTQQAAAWSDRDLDRRFELGPPHDELTQLAATLDGLLDRLAASLRRERRFSAELSHELRTPLARVIAEAELALRRERDLSEYKAALHVVLENARQIGRIVETLVTVAQHEAGAVRGTADAFGVAKDAVGAVREEAARRRIRVEAEPPALPLRVGVDVDLAERVLQPVVENACRYGRSWVRVSVARNGSRILYAVEDDGPGVGDEERESIFEPGVRGRAGAQSVGAGLGLALARRLARAAAGEVSAEPSERGGSFVVSLPVA